MLLRPRKTLFKNSQKKRSPKANVNYNFFSNNSSKLVYGQVGLLNKTRTFLFFNKYIFKIKLFLKKAVRRTNITNRFLWLKIFPHIPVSKKVIGSRMGKGKGKPSNWAAIIPYKCIFLELKNTRIGRSYYFIRQVIYKLPGNYIIIYKHKITKNTVIYNGFSKLHNNYTSFI